MTSPDVIYNVVDRSGSIYPQSEIAVLTPVGSVTTPLSITDLFAARATSILRNSGDKKIFVAYSGGIDSTTVLAEFLKIAPPGKIGVLMNNNSITEYPDFYTKYINSKLEVREFSLYNSDSVDSVLADGNIIVTGAGADQAMGDTMSDALSEQHLTQTINDVLASVSKKSAELYRLLIQACPRELVDSKDLGWWRGYVLDYQNEEMVWALLSDRAIIGKNVIHFYTSVDWNNYAVSTPSEIKWPGCDLRKYKQVIKDHLQEFTHDDYYTREKIKIYSWRRYRTAEQQKIIPISITTDWKRGYRI
jgi:hypothetical protein